MPHFLDDRIGRGVRALWRELATFGTVGLAAFVVDVGLSNWLWGTQDSPGPMHDSAIKAKCISVAVATIVAYVGNRHWTYRDRRRPVIAHEFLLFVLFNVAGMTIAAACLLVNDYVLDLRSSLARNVAGNGVGLVLGTLFRFWGYRTFVFRHGPAEVHEQREPVGVQESAHQDAPVRPHISS